MSIEIVRTASSNVAGECILCTEHMQAKMLWKTHALYQFFPDDGLQLEEETEEFTEIRLCPFHEFKLMEKMFNNWHKRLLRGKKGNPRAKLPRKKDEGEEVEENESRDEAINANP